MDKFQLQSTVSKLDTTLTRDSQRKDKLVPQDQNSETVHFSDVVCQRRPQQLTGDDDQQVTVREMSLHESKLSLHLDKRSTGGCKVQPSMSFGRHRSNSLPETCIAGGVASVESFTDSISPSNINNSSAVTAPMPSLVAEADQPVVALSQNKHVEKISKLVSSFQHSMELDNDQQPEQSDQQQMPLQCFSRQQDGKTSFQCHRFGPLGQKDKKRDDLSQKTRLIQSTRELQKPEVRGSLQSTPLSKSGELSQPLTSAAVPTSLESSYNNLTALVLLGQQREKPLGLETVSTVTGVNSSQPGLQNELVHPSMSFGQHRSNSLSVSPIASRVALTGSIIDSVTPLNLSSPSTGTAHMPSLVAMVDQPVAAVSQNKHVESISELVPMFQHSMKLDNDQQPERRDQQQIPSWCFSPQQDGKLSFQWHSVGQLGRKDKKGDDSLQKTKLVQISRQLQKTKVRDASRSSPLSKSGELSQPPTSATVLTDSFGPSYNKMTAHVALGQQREESLALATVSTSVTGVNSSQLDSQNQQVQPSVSFGMHTPNSLPELVTASGGASPDSIIDLMTPLNIASPSTGTISMCSFVGKTDQPVAALGQNKQLETISKLVSVLKRHGLHNRKRKIDELPKVKKRPHYSLLHLNVIASDANNEEQQDARGQRSVTDSMAPSNTNNSSIGTAPMCRLEPSTDLIAAALGQNIHLEKISELVSMFQRHGLHTTKRKIDEYPEEKKQPPYRALPSIALPSDVNNEDQQDVKGQRSMAISVVQGGVNVCKSRIISFERTEFLPQGAPVMHHINRVRLVMCELAKDGMVEAVVQHLSSSTSHDDLLSLPNTRYADTLAMQFCALMVKDGYKLTEDQIQPNFPPTSASLGLGVNSICVSRCL